MGGHLSSRYSFRVRQLPSRATAYGRPGRRWPGVSAVAGGISRSPGVSAAAGASAAARTAPLADARPLVLDSADESPPVVAAEGQDRPFAVLGVADGHDASLIVSDLNAGTAVVGVTAGAPHGMGGVEVRGIHPARL